MSGGTSPEGTPPPRPRSAPTDRTWKVIPAPPSPPPLPKVAGTERRGVRLWGRDAVANLGFWLMASVPATVGGLAILGWMSQRHPLDEGGGTLPTALCTAAFAVLAVLLWTLHHLSSALVLRRLAAEYGFGFLPLSTIARRMPRSAVALVTANPVTVVAPALFGVYAMEDASLGFGFVLFWLLVALPSAIAPSIVLVEDAGPLEARRRAKVLLARRGGTAPWFTLPPFLLSLLLLWSGSNVFGSRGLDARLVPWCVPAIFLCGSLWGAVNASDYAALREASDGGSVAAVFE